MAEEEDSSVPIGRKIYDMNEEMTHIDPAHYFRPGGLYGFQPQPHLISKYWLPFWGTVSGGVIVGLENWTKRKPIVSGGFLTLLKILTLS